MIFTNDRPRSSSSVRPVASASSSVIAPQFMRAQEVVEQALAGGGVVEDVADERRLRGLLR